MSNSGRGGRRRPFRNRDRGNFSPPLTENSAGNAGDNQGIRSLTGSSASWQKDGKRGGKPRFDKNRGVLVDRPKWIAPRVNQEPLPEPECPLCGKPIKDLAAALADKASGTPAHFDCVLGLLGEREPLEEGDELSYIGGGRFGIIHYSAPHDRRIFQIKKILQWEDQNVRSDWRRQVTERYSTT
ncbi:MAG: hypothetical protein LBH73_01520 [Spirochaetaceae bacterium]|jgi:hypothetical protein|nr:hypothetical protein [Spirochaetaceae bacterium]